MKVKFLALLMMVSFGFVACEDDSDEESALYKVPTEIQAYVDQHFPQQTVIQARLEADDQSNYELLLDNFIKLEFNVQKSIVEIDGPVKLPDSVIPASVLSYVSTNYPDQHIVAWELDATKQQVELNNHVELEFDLQGNFIRIDN